MLKESYSCNLMLAMDVVGGKWKMVILWYLRKGTLRFNELRKMLDGITQKMLTQQLRELETDGLLERKVYPVVPPKVEYSLTEQGEKLIPVLEAIYLWSGSYADQYGISTCCGLPLES